MGSGSVSPLYRRSSFERLTFGISWLGCPIIACTARSAASFDLSILREQAAQVAKAEGPTEIKHPHATRLAPEADQKPEVGVNVDWVLRKATDA